MLSRIQDYSVFSQYFAPHGRERLLFLGEQIAQRHLTHTDRLVGIVGDAGSGKSSLIRGMFPGLELSNDDDMLNPRKIMQVRDLFEDVQQSTTYHIDMRFQIAFTQMYEIVEFVQNALEHKRRVIVEHFNLLYPALGMNADILVGIGEEIIVTRPSIFGPQPQSIYNIVSSSLHYRRVAHTIEDITMLILSTEFNVDRKIIYPSDMRNGFILKLTKEVDLDFERLNARVKEEIAKNLDICYFDEDHILIGGTKVVCNFPRLHVLNTSEVEAFTLIKRYIPDPKSDTFCIVGVLSNDENISIDNLNTVHFLQRKKI
ncbi:tRNA A37 threonylcarbamoyladenosine biosynthesis protein TsaE [Parabacteroides sp. PFB2-10]|uniref:alanine-tRNA synthetase second additional domain-containing protein n=1 Tax=Parabacteroides sp. PFB2-10 TaxID=1742405 RepID=UPI002474BA3D|nr:alanine-tRNA synthetase second additional domain-containing protein [Parabacteroides sp. PFB2-10]MDH6312328.1 tRNA A37 threonylcarbamoyladenosine biosynthesis protein TsaE [Parabacteroides sp. PFB2-10]MDL2244762.1 alanine-tRNA synthetase second additional domain-containing protein [Parabacteroides sp. OttesenSCG-928-J18]